MKNKNILENLAAVTAGKVKTSGVSAFNELEISKVFPNPDQPRKQFDDIEELAATIKEHGLLQPITVVKKDNGYMIIAGERRYKAHLYNEAKTIKAYIVDVSEEQVEELTLIENIQRNDLTDFELAKHICKLWDSGRYEKKSDLATRIGKSDSYVSKSFNCLKLDSEIIDHIEQNKTPISIGVMDEIARVKDPVVQKEVYEKYNNKEITRDDIKDFKPKKTIKEKVEEIFIKPPISCNYVEGNSREILSKFICYGFGTQNKFGAFVTPVDHDIKTPFDYQFGGINGVLKFNHLQQIIKINHSDSINYKITIEEISDMEYTYIDKMRKDFNDALIKTDKYKTIDYKHRELVELVTDNNALKEKIKELEKEIEELKQNKPTPKEKAPIKDDEPKEIKLLELNENDVYVEYMDNESEHISYNKAKTLIKNSKKEYIKYENTGSEKACNFLNTLPKDILKTGEYLKKQYKF